MAVTATDAVDERLPDMVDDAHVDCDVVADSDAARSSSCVHVSSSSSKRSVVRRIVHDAAAALRSLHVQQLRRKRRWATREQHN